jgi:hypothetical protein
MQYSKFLIFDTENSAFIYSGLRNISEKGRKRMKIIAQSLIALQNRPGTPVPDSICHEIIREENCRPEFGKG